MSINGTLNLCKPPGWTSFDLVRDVKRLTHQKKVGHGGTLDPLASGVLPICIGQATRVTEFLAEAEKTYTAAVAFGAATDTYDAEGQVTSTGDPSSITLPRLEQALEQFRGPIEQEPPMYSALKHQGKRLYELARAGVVVERKKRETVIHRLEIAGWEPPVANLEIECGRGTYIRSLAHDLGVALGCGAYLKELMRLRTGPFDIGDSVDPEQFAAAVEQGRWQELLYPIDFALRGMDAAIIDRKAERAVLSGQPVPVIYADYEAVNPSGPRSISKDPDRGTRFMCRAYSLDGRFLAILSAPTLRGPWVPKKVFLPTARD